MATATAAVPVQATPDIDPIFAAAAEYEKQKVVLRDQYQQAYDIAVSGGLEVSSEGSAGIHLLYTQVDDPQTMGRSFPLPGDGCVREWCFWPCSARYMIAYQDWHAADGSSIDSIPCSFNRLVPNAAFTTRLETQANGLVSLFLDFDSRGLGYLNFISQPKSTSDAGMTTEDWYGIERDTSLPHTELRIIVVQNDQAYLPISVTDILALTSSTGQQTYSALAASDLTPAEATSLSAGLL